MAPTRTEQEQGAAERVIFEMENVLPLLLLPKSYDPDVCDTLPAECCTTGRALYEVSHISNHPDRSDISCLRQVVMGDVGAIWTNNISVTQIPNALCARDGANRRDDRWV